MASTKKLKYDTSFLNFGFFVITSDGLQKPQCVVCFEVLAHTSLKPSKLKRHLESKHPDLVDKNLSFFQRMEENLELIQHGRVKRGILLVLNLNIR